MSSITEKIDLIPISAPLISDVQYGESIKTIFNNINNNFNKLTNSGFLSGVQGESIEVSKILLSNSDPEGNIWLNAIKTAISKYIGDIELLNSINGVNWYDDILNKYIYVYRAVIENEDSAPKNVSILPFTVKDARFKDVGFTELDEYENIEDASCVIGFNGVMNGNSPVIEVMNTIPTIYFDSSVGKFCWKIWGNKTGLIASGPPGKDGENGEVIVCIKSEDPINSNIYPITRIVPNSGYPFDVKSENYTNYIGKTAIILPSEEEKDKQPGFWISTLNESSSDDFLLQAICDSYNNVITSLTITPEYMRDEIMQNLTSYFLKLSNGYFNIKQSEGSIIMDKTDSPESSESIEGELSMKMNTKIIPYLDNESEDNKKNSLEVTTGGIFITLEGVRYKLETTTIEEASGSDILLKLNRQ